MSQILLACWKEARRPMSGEMFRVWMCIIRIWSRPTFMAGLNHPRTEPRGTWSVGSTSRYIYELANWNHTKKLRSNELLQIDKKDMQVKLIWTFAVSNGKRENNRHFLNEDVIDDNTILALFHGKSKHRFEIWKITRTGNSFKVKEVATTDGDLISNSS